MAAATRALARVNVAAIERNVARLSREAGTTVCAVVKADGYGHGSVAAARAAVAGGASWLAVATAAEARQLRTSGLQEPRILVMGALTRSELQVALEADADVAAWTEPFVEWLTAAGHPARVHIKLDTGMGRLGTRDTEEAGRIAAAVAAAPSLEVAGLWTHFATADEPGDDFFGEQLGRFSAWISRIHADHPSALVHAANSAATFRDPAARFDMVRCGIAVYGMDPFGEDPAERGLEPALELVSYVAAIKEIAPGESAGYGRRFVAERETVLATVPLGYGDGYRRGLTNNAEVLIGGHRHPVAGTVSMDNITVDIGGAREIGLGDEVVVLGARGAEAVTAEELARRLATINYEVTCGISARVPRLHHRDGDPVTP